MSQLKDFFWLIQAPYPEMEELQLRLFEKVFYFGAKRPFFPKKWWHHQKKVIALNMYIDTNVLMYERWLVL